MAGDDRIGIRDLEVDCVVGIYPSERGKPQPLLLDADLWLDTEPAALAERLHLSVNYAAIAAQLSFLLQNARFRMLETAAHALCRYLLAPPAPDERRAQIAKVRLSLRKPTILPGRVVPSLEITREASWVRLVQEQKSFGVVDVVHESRYVGIYRLNIAPGKGIPLHVHRRMREAEMVLGEGLLCQRRPVAPGTVHRWPLDAPHCYDNPSRRYQTVLCVDCPPFIEADEVLVEGEPALVAPESPA
ncbi:MAG: dihydroneopterin aldolase [Myxococcales bacterium]|nr:dihydroneopterin aldolase [Myxococcales bacterium]